MGKVYTGGTNDCKFFPRIEGKGKRVVFVGTRINGTITIKTEKGVSVETTKKLN